MYMIVSSTLKNKFQMGWILLPELILTYMIRLLTTLFLKIQIRQILHCHAKAKGPFMEGPQLEARHHL